MYLHIATCGVYCIFWPDMMHKLARKASYSLTRSGGNLVIRKLTKLFRASRGPWSSSKFGKLLSDCRQMLVKGLQEGNIDQSVLDTWLPGIARDNKTSPDTFSHDDLLKVLQRKSGQ